MIDHAKLREAIAELRLFARHWPDHDPSKARTLSVCDAAESTLPKTRMVEVWRVEYATNGVPGIVSFVTRTGADDWVNGAKGLAYISCIRVTGPHQQSIPAELRSGV